MTDVTILLTLRGRHLHTLRWLWHANRIRLPFHVVIADGDVHPTVERVLSKGSSFPNLSYEYHRYADRSFSDFYRKCVDALGKVNTRYVKIVDNDDFLFPSGVTRLAAFLDHAPEYVCAGAGIPGFVLEFRPGPTRYLVGTFERIDYRYLFDGSYACRDIDQGSVTERVLDELNRYLSLYYFVYRTDAMRVVAADIQRLDFSDLDIHERFFALRTVTLGKVKSDPSYFFYFRQHGTSSHFSYEADWVDHLLRSRLPEDFRAMASSVAAIAEQQEGADRRQLEEKILQGYAAILRRMLAGTMLRHRFPRLFTLKQRYLALPRLRLPASMRRNRAKERLWRQLAAHGGERATIDIHQSELGDIQATLEGAEFIQFIASNAPELASVA